MAFGRSSEELPKIDWSKEKAVVWLDYDGKLEKECLNDIQLLCSEVISGSFICFSVNVDGLKVDFSSSGSLQNLSSEEPSASGEKKPYQKALDYLTKEFGESGLLLNGLTRKDLAKWGFSDICRQIINNQIEETLKQRNGVLPEENQLLYKQVFNFHYADGARMLTLGGLILEKNDQSNFDRCDFEKLEFYRSDENNYLIQPPLLTFKEVRELDKFMPLGGKKIKVPIPDNLVSQYSKLYRYFPSFTEAEI